MKGRNILFVSSDLSREIILLARELARRGHSVAVASPASENAPYLLDVRHIEIPQISIFGRRLMFMNKELKSHIAVNGPKICAFDGAAAALCRTPARRLSAGIDIRIYNPSAVSILRQEKLLRECNIAPHQKMLALLSPLGVGLGTLVSALDKLPRDDFIVAMFGTITKWRAKKLVAQVAASGAGGKIIFVGDKLDLPSFLRASFAAVSLGSHSERLLKAAVAMARPTVWTDNEFGIRPNIMMESASAEDIARALDAALGLSEQRRAEYEKRNLADAQSFSIEKIADDFLNGG